MRQKGFAPIVIVVFVLIGIAGVYLLGMQERSGGSSPSQPPSLIESTPSPVVPVNSGSTPTSKPVQNGVGIDDIKYTLPLGWEAEIRDGGLAISASGGGYFFIKVYDYAGDVGRRDYYCQLVRYCVDASYFTEMKIGNISGYKANALDNSGGGSDYFGAKGNKFYVINSFSPSTSAPNEYDKNSQQVLNSLVF